MSISIFYETVFPLIQEAKGKTELKKSEILIA